MGDEMEIPQEFGGSWEAFRRDWCLDVAIAYSEAEASRGLSTLKRLWPGAVARIVGKTERGASLSASAIAKGLLFETCEAAKYFRGVLKRLKSGERSAYSELVLVAALCRLGYATQCAARVGGSVPDAHCIIDGVPVSFEVYAPDQSDASHVRGQLVKELRAAISREVSESRVEIGLLEVFGRDDIPAAVTMIRSAASGTWSNVGDWARIRRVDHGQRLPPSFDGDGTETVFVGEVATQGPSTGLIISWEESDPRAEAKLQDKHSQLSQGVANVLVINTCEIGGIGEWPEVIARLLASGYEKIGVVAFFYEGWRGPPEGVRRRWRIVVNPRAEIPIPETLLTGLESLDESSHWDLERKERLIAG
jgi:hypothetical protein